MWCFLNMYTIYGKNKEKVRKVKGEILRFIKKNEKNIKNCIDRWNIQW